MNTWCACSCGAPVWPENFNVPGPDGTPVYYVDETHYTMDTYYEDRRNLATFTDSGPYSLRLCGSTVTYVADERGWRRLDWLRRSFTKGTTS